MRFVYVPTRLLTLWNILPVDPDVLVSVAPGVLVVEPQRMDELMLNDSVRNTAIHRQRHLLFPSRSPYSRPTAVNKGIYNTKIISVTIRVWLNSSNVHYSSKV